MKIKEERHYDVNGNMTKLVQNEILKDIHGNYKIDNGRYVYTQKVNGKEDFHHKYWDVN